MSSKQKIVVRDVSKKYRLFSNKTDRLLASLLPFSKGSRDEFFALRNIHFTAHEGDIVGIIGKNGSGKSTLLKIIAGITTPTSGSCQTFGKVIPLIELGAGFHPELTGRENIYFYTSILGFKKHEMNGIVEDVIAFADIGRFIDQPVKMYSSGMKARLSFSVSVFINPDILIVDEILSVGDESFKNKSNEKIKSLFKSGKTILFVTHSLGAMASLCNRGVLMDHGQLIGDGTPQEIIKQYQEINRQLQPLAP